MRYVEYKVVPGQWHNVEKSNFCDLRKGQFKVKVKIEGEKHIYIILATHSYHYQSSIVIGL